MRNYRPRPRHLRQAPPSGFHELLPDSVVDLFAGDSVDPTHLVPDTGHARFRQSACGVMCAEGRLTHERETHGRGSSTLANVDCEECLRLSRGSESLFSSERDNREAPACECGAPVFADGLCVAHHAAKTANGASSPNEQEG